MRLAALAGPSNPEAVAHHQEAALLVAEAGKAWHLVSTVRRDQAYWAEARGDWHRAWELYSQNIELSEKQIWKVGVPSGAVALQARTQPDYEGAVEACLTLAKSNPQFYQRALESAEHGKARAFLHSLGRIGTTLGAVSPKLNERRNRILQQMSDHPPASAEETERLQIALKTVEDQIWTHPRSCAMDLQCVPCTYEQMCALVPRDGVILSYFSLPDRLVIFVLTENGLATPPAVVNVPKKTCLAWHWSSRPGSGCGATIPPLKTCRNTWIWPWRRLTRRFICANFTKSFWNRWPPTSRTNA
jgi:hypothetical protein